MAKRKRNARLDVLEKCPTGIIDLLRDPRLAKGDQILAVPTLVRKLPVPVRRIIGDLSNIRDLLEYSKVGDKGKRLSPVDLSAVADNAKANLQAAIKESDAVITTDTLPTVMADAGEMRQLFQNLLGNAIKFRADGRRPDIHVGARQDGGSWLLQVKDNGIGIAPEQCERVFEIFQRLNPREQYAGTGVGLAICKRIVERHGGRIWVNSVPGEGSTFCFSLPVGPK